MNNSTEIRIANHAILFDNGTFRLKPTDIQYVKQIIQGKRIVSHITYQGAATFLSATLNVEIKVNQGPFKLDVGEEIIVFRQFTVDKYEWKILERIN